MIRPLALLPLAALWACGGGSNNGPSAPAQNAFTGTVAVTSPLPAGVTTCQGVNKVVHFKAAGAGADDHSPSVAGGGCITFQNDDSAPHQPAARSAVAGCGGLNAPAAIAATGSFTTGPLGTAAGPESCDWIDSLNPPGAGGGGGGY